jgi:hypothetical protein
MFAFQAKGNASLLDINPPTHLPNIPTATYARALRQPEINRLFLLVSLLEVGLVCLRGCRLQRKRFPFGPRVRGRGRLKGRIFT